MELTLSTTIKCAAWNMQGLKEPTRKRSQRPKFAWGIQGSHENVWGMLSENDVVFISETWKKPSDEPFVKDKDGRFDFGSFEQKHFPRPQGKDGGGQMILYNRQKVNLEILKTRCDHFVVSKIINKMDTEKSAIVISCYVPSWKARKRCHECKKSRLELLDVLSNLLKMYKKNNQNTAVVGDLNVWTNGMEDGWGIIKTKHRPKKTPGIYGQRLTEVCKEQGFCIVNGRAEGDREGEYTRVCANNEPSVLDYLIVPVNLFDSKRLFCVSTQTTESHSDHRPLLFRLKLTQTESVNRRASQPWIIKKMWQLLCCCCCCCCRDPYRYSPLSQ